MLLFMDGASHYSTAELGNKWTTVNSAFCTFTQVAGEGRADGCIKRASTANSGNCGYLAFAPLMTQTAEWVPTYQGTFGCAIKFDDLARQVPTASGPSFGIQSATNLFFSVWSGSQVHFGVNFNEDGTLSLIKAKPSSTVEMEILANSIQGIQSGVYGYVEIRWVLSSSMTATDGSCEIRVNGNTVLTYAGSLYCRQNIGFPNPPRTWTSIRVMGTQSLPSPFLVMRMCDVYLADHAAPNGGFLGDIYVAYIRPNGIGAYSNWTPLSAPNWSEVNEVPPDGDTSYVEATAVGTRDAYEFEDVIGDPVAIQVCNFVRKTDAAGASLKVITRQGGVDYDGPEIGIGTQTYTYRLQPYDTNPATAAAWTKAEMDAGQWGPLKAS